MKNINFDSKPSNGFEAENNGGDWKIKLTYKKEVLKVISVSPDIAEKILKLKLTDMKDIFKALKEDK